MKNFSFEVGAQIRLFNRLLVVEQRSGRSCVLRDVKSQELETRKFNELHKAFAGGNLHFVDLLDALQDDDVTGPSELERVLSDYSDSQRSGALAKYAYLKAICPTGRLKVARAELPGAIHAVWHELPMRERGEHPPSVSTFYSWRHEWQRGNYSVQRLVNRYDLRGRQPAPVDKRIQPILDKVVNDFFGSSARPAVAETVRLANAEVRRHNQVRSPGDQLPEVTARQVVREIGRVDRYEILKRRYGVARARTATRVFGERSEVLRPLQRVEIDHTPLDVLAASDDLQGILGRAFATVIIDVATRMILAVWISFREPNADSVLRALKQAILPKGELLKRLGIKGEWPAWGVMETLYLDNGKEFHSNALEAAAEDLGITLVYCPPREPFMKGTIERFLKELNYKRVHQLPGTTFAKYGLREDYKSEQFAVLTLEEVRRFVTRWVVEEYSNAWHRGIQACPLQKWKELVKPEDLCLPRRRDMLDVVLAHSQERSLTSKGIEINALHYTCDELAGLRLRHGKQKLIIRPNHDDLGEIKVLNPETQHYFEARCTRPDYACGLTLEQHQFLRKQARKAYAALPHLDALLAAKLEMHEELAELVASRSKENRKSGTTKRREAKKHSGRDLQAKVEFAARQANVAAASAAEVAADDSPTDAWSFDDVGTYPTGQSILV